MPWSTAVRCVVAASVIAVIGCSGSDRPKTVHVEGVVTYQGEPVAEAQVSFIPAQGRPASGTTGADGRFTLMTFEPDDGAVLGEHTVTIEKTALPSDQEGASYAEQMSAKRVSLIPEQYANVQSSPLKATVSADGPNEFEFELKD